MAHATRHRPASKKGAPPNRAAAPADHAAAPPSSVQAAEPRLDTSAQRADTAARRMEDVRTSLLFAIQHLGSIAGGREVLLGCGLSEELEAEIGAGLEDQRQEAALCVMAGRLYDAPLLGLLARSRLAGLMLTADSGEWAQLALVLQRLPRWLLETPRERAARLEAENLALALPYRRPRRRRGTLVGAEQCSAPTEEEDEDELCMEDIPAYDPTMRIVAQGRIDRESRKVGWTDPVERLKHPYDRVIAEFSWPTLEERAAEAVSDERLFGNVYNVWKLILVDPKALGNRPQPLNPDTGELFTDQDCLDGMERMERWK